MIVRNIDGVIKHINVAKKDEDDFLAKNTTGGFMLVDSLPEQTQSGSHYKWNGTAIVVDDEANAADAQDVINQEARDYLASTDWMLSRELDGGVAMTAEVKQLRAEARARVI
jgi:hypothetical protein